MNLLLLLITVGVFIKSNAFKNDVSSVKSCKTCKWFIPNNNRQEYGLCSLFKERIYIADQERLINNFAKHCRNNELLCGKEGLMHEEFTSVVTIQEKLQQFGNRYDAYIDNLNQATVGHGEVNEKSDIDELNNLDKEFASLSKEALELFMKVKRYNKKKISIKLDSINYLFPKKR
jgi:hypothetical protein